MDSKEKLYRWTFRMEKYLKDAETLERNAEEDLISGWPQEIDGVSQLNSHKYGIGKIGIYTVLCEWCDIEEV